MSLRPQPIPPVPAETARVAHAAFPRGNRYLHLRDEIGTIFTDDVFAALFSRRGRPVLAPWRLALVTLMQYAENLSDRRAADAVRSRVDWKYALSLELDDPGFDSTVLCEFRSRLVEGQSETLLLERLLQICRERKLLQARGKQRTDSTHVLAAVTALNRLQCAIETLRHALNVLAMVAPDWLQAHAPSAWAQRYAPRATDHPLPTTETSPVHKNETLTRRRLEAMVACLKSIWSIPVMWMPPYWLRRGRTIKSIYSARPDRTKDGRPAPKLAFRLRTSHWTGTTKERPVLPVTRA